MKKNISLGLLFLLLFYFGQSVYSEETAITLNGTQVILYDDGTWEKVGGKDTETKWTASKKIDPLDDSRIINYVLMADSGSSSWGDMVSLVVRDTNGKYDLYINWHDYLGSDITVTHRVDDNEPQTQEWSLSTDSEASFYLNYAYPPLKELIKQLSEAETFVARCTPYGENPITAIFDVRGLKGLFNEYGSKVPK